MKVTIKEFKNNVEKYLQKSLEEDVFIIDESNKPAYRLTNYLMETFNSLVGTLPEAATIEEGREERLNRHLL